MYSLKDRECWKLDAMVGIEIEKHMHVFLFCLTYVLFHIKSIHDFIDFISIVSLQTKCISTMIHTYVWVIGHFSASYPLSLIPNDSLEKAWRWAIYILDKASERPANGVRGFVFPWRVSFRGVSKVAQKRIAGWWFRNFHTLFGEDSHFDSYFSDGLKPPTRLGFVPGDTPLQFNSQSPWKNGGTGRRILSYWVSVTFRGRAAKLQGGYVCYHGKSPWKTTV